MHKLLKQKADAILVEQATAANKNDLVIQRTLIRALPAVRIYNSLCRHDQALSALIARYRIGDGGYVNQSPVCESFDLCLIYNGTKHHKQPVR